jgi:hypothetical protein
VLSIPIAARGGPGRQLNIDTLQRQLARGGSGVLRWRDPDDENGRAPAVVPAPLGEIGQDAETIARAFGLPADSVTVRRAGELAELALAGARRPVHARVQRRTQRRGPDHPPGF